MKGVPTSMYQEALSRQLALDYCCSPADVADSKNHFTIYVPQEGRRRFQEQTVCRLKIAVVNGKLLVTGSEEIVAECRKRYADVTGEWFFDMKRLRELEELLAPFDLRIAQVHPFFLPESGGIASSDLPSALLSDARDFELIRYDQDAILLPFLENVVNSCLQNRCLLSDGRKGTIIYINKDKLSRPVVQCSGEYVNLADQPDLEIVRLL